MPSQQKELTDRYKRLSAPQKLVVLLMALKVFLPKRGVRRVLYRKTDLGGGIVSLNEAGEEQPVQDDLDEWSDDLKITDADAALRDLPGDFVGSMISAINAVAPFLPAFGKSHYVPGNRRIWTARTMMGACSRDRSRGTAQLLFSGS